MRFVLYALFLFPFLSASYHADAYIIAGLNAQAPTGASIHLLGDVHTPTAVGKQQFKQLTKWAQDSQTPCYLFVESCPWETYTKGYTDVTLRDTVVYAREHNGRIGSINCVQADGRSRESVRVQFMCVSLWHALFKTGYMITPEMINYPKQLNRQLSHYGSDMNKGTYLNVINSHISDLEKRTINNGVYKQRVADIKSLHESIQHNLSSCDDAMSISDCFSRLMKNQKQINWESSVFNACINIDTYIADAYFIKYLYEYKDSGYPLLFIIGQAHVIALKEALGEMHDCTIASEIGLTSHVAQTTQECIAIDIEPLLKVQAGQITLLQWLRSLIALLLSPFV